MSTNAELEKRIRDLETTRTIVVAIAVIFGVSGGWGAYRLNQINGAIDSAQARVKGLEDTIDTANKAARALDAAHALKNQVKGAQAGDAEAKVSATAANQMQHGEKNAPVRKERATNVAEKPFQAAVETFRMTTPPEPYVLEGYEHDLRGLSDLLLGYLGYMQSGNRVDRATSDAFYGQMLLAATDVKARSSQKLSRDDPYFEWHTKTSLDNFMAIVGKMKNDQQGSPDNGLPSSRITYYETDIPHWRDGVLGVPLG
jgi:hypothetical protein